MNEKVRATEHTRAARPTHGRRDEKRQKFNVSGCLFLWCKMCVIVR